MVSICLRADEGFIESNADLFEDGMSYVVHQVRVLCGRCIGRPIGFLQFPFQFKVTAREINEIFLRIDLKIDRVDPCGERMNGDHARTHDAEISGRNPKEVQHGVLDPCRPGQWDNVRHRRLRLRLFFRELLTQS